MKIETLSMTKLGTVFVKYSISGIETWNHAPGPYHKKEGLAALYQRKIYRYHGTIIEFKYKNGTYIWTW